MTEHVASAEKRLEALERRMSLLLEGGSGATEEDSSAEMNGFKTMILGRCVTSCLIDTSFYTLIGYFFEYCIQGKLKLIRDKISAEGGDGMALRKERDAALAENERMKKEIEKLNYRVNHLIKELNAAESN